MIRDGDFKLIEFFECGQLELYDLVRDPSESRNLVRHEPAVAYRLSRLNAIRTTMRPMPSGTS